jgi:hypothetical protein
MLSNSWKPLIRLLSDRSDRLSQTRLLPKPLLSKVTRRHLGYLLLHPRVSHYHEAQVHLPPILKPLLFRVNSAPTNLHIVDQSHHLYLYKSNVHPSLSFRGFSSVVRRMPGYRLTQRRGTARIPPKAQRPHEIACIQSRI